MEQNVPEFPLLWPTRGWNIFVGNLSGALDWQILKTFGITHILFLGDTNDDRVMQAGKHAGAQCFYFPLGERLDKTGKKLFLETVMPWMREAWKEVDSRLLIVSRDGINRVPTVAVVCIAKMIFDVPDRQCRGITSDQVAGRALELMGNTCDTFMKPAPELLLSLLDAVGLQLSPEYSKFITDLLSH